MAEIPEDLKELYDDCGDGTKTSDTLVNSETIKPLIEHIAALRKLCGELRDTVVTMREELDTRYDGADDSRTKWMAYPMAQADEVLAKAQEVLK